MRWRTRVAVVGVVAAACVGVYALLRYQHPSVDVADDAYVGQVEQFHSSQDADGDGIDDQVDVLEGARAYVDTRPRYESRYYAGGWSDDGYGVCTDVVARALLAAGYDLQALMEEDIAAAPEAYGIDAPDANIDFRRVANQQTWLARHAVSLTTDTSDIEAWQGGDIVVFHEHIGVVSDRRTSDGVPYVIHHESAWQASYEEDVLHHRSDVLGHYRVSE